MGGAARSRDVEWNEGVNVPGQKLDGRGNQLRDEQREREKNPRIAENATVLDTGDAAGVPALKGGLKQEEPAGGTAGAQVNRAKWDKSGEIVSMFVAT